MLLGDGSPTRHLQLLTNQETKIKLISMQVDPLFIEEGPKELNQLNGPLIRRQVWIKNNNKNLAWAESWWNAEQVNENLKAKEEPIWKNLTQDRSELFNSSRRNGSRKSTRGARCLSTIFRCRIDNSWCRARCHRCRSSNTRSISDIYIYESLLSTSYTTSVG